MSKLNVLALAALLALFLWQRRRRVYVTASGLRVLAATENEMDYWQRKYMKEFES